MIFVPIALSLGVDGKIIHINAEKIKTLSNAHTKRTEIMFSDGWILYCETPVDDILRMIKDKEQWQKNRQDQRGES